MQPIWYAEGGRMPKLKLSQVKKEFFELRKSCEIFISSHSHEDHPARGFTELELINLVQKGNGVCKLNNYPSAIEGSFLFCPKDLMGNVCELVIKLETEQAKDGTEKIIIVCSAYREDIC